MAKAEINDEERLEICAKLEWEGGLEYLIMGDSFSDIKDAHFHELCKKFVAAAQELKDYLEYDKFLDECIGDPPDDETDEL